MPPKRTPSSTPNPSTGASSSTTSNNPSSSPTTSASTHSRSASSSTKLSSLNNSNNPYQNIQSIVTDFLRTYDRRTPSRVKLVDAFLAFLVVVGVTQFVYCVLGGGYPFNAFLSGFAATVGEFVLTVSLRMQTNPENKSEFSKVSQERAFADYVLSSLLLHFFCVNFIN